MLTAAVGAVVRHSVLPDVGGAVVGGAAGGGGAAVVFGQGGLTVSMCVVVCVHGQRMVNVGGQSQSIGSPQPICTAHW